MQEEDIENRPDMNTGKKWSEMALMDLANCIRLGDPIEEIASFLCRLRNEIRKKVDQLEWSGALPHLIEQAAAAAVPETDDPEIDEIGFGENSPSDE